jgi:gas vesicle protein
MALTDEMIAWLQRNREMSGSTASLASAPAASPGATPNTKSNSPGTAKPPAAATSPDPWGGTANSPTSTDSGQYPRPMQADCVVVHGKVKGPDNHVLCGKHGHILDTEAKTIIARDLKDYEARQLVGKVAQAAAPIVQGVADGLQALGGVAAHLAGSPDAHPNAAPQAPTADDPNVIHGKGSALGVAMAAMAAHKLAVANAITRWRDDASDAVKAADSSSAAVGKMILAITGIVVGAVLPAAGALALAAKSFKTLEEATKAAEALEKAEKVASKIESVSKGPEKAFEMEEDAAKEELAEADAAIKKCADEALGKLEHVLAALPKIVTAALDKLTDQDSMERFSRAGPDDLLVICDRLGINKKTLAAEVNKLRAQLDIALRRALMDGAVAKARKNLGSSGDSQSDRVHKALMQGGRSDEEYKAWVEKEVSDYQTQWAKDYDDHVNSVLQDKEVEYAQEAAKD